MMTSKIRFAVLLHCICCAWTWAQTNRQFVAYKYGHKQLEVQVTDGTYYFQPYNDHSIETHFVPKGESWPTHSHAVQAEVWGKAPKPKNTTNLIRWDLGLLKIEIQKQPFALRYYRRDQLILAEKDGYSHTASGENLSFALHASESLMGGGARALGMNRRGKVLRLYNRAHYGYETQAELMNFCLPIVASSQKYLLHFDNPTTGSLDLDSQKNNTLTYTCLSGRKTYQLITHDDWAHILETYTQLTGRQPLPPKWAFGQFSSRFGYHTQDEVNQTLEKFERDSIPVDAYVLDLYWFGKSIKGTMGNLEWDKDNFPAPDKMMQRWRDKGVKTVLITEPFILSTSLKWDEALREKALVLDSLKQKPAEWEFYFGHTGLVDVFSTTGQNWFWKQYARLINQGAAGLWGDLGEPEVFPSWAHSAAGPADAVHNIYGHQWAKILFQNYQKYYPQVRPFILMRAGYSGSQRYGMIPWSGDVNRSWGGLQSQTEIALQMGVQGIGYMHSDLGGFAGDYFDNELYLRWLQYGVYQPIFRPHAQEEVASEVARKDIVTKAKAKKAVMLRYKMLPYNYSLAFENSQNGVPLMRPLFWEQPNNSQAYTISDTYLWGPNILVKPITQAGVTQTQVTFPDTANWFDWVTGVKYAKGSTATVPVSDTAIPTFVRGGSFIPLRPDSARNTQYRPEVLELHYYFDPECPQSSFTTYDDDGQTPEAFAKGLYEKIYAQAQIDKNQLRITVKPEKGAQYQSPLREVRLLVHYLKPQRLWVNGQEEVRKRFEDPLEVRLPLSNNPVEVQIQWQ